MMFHEITLSTGDTVLLEDKADRIGISVSMSITSGATFVDVNLEGDNWLRFVGLVNEFEACRAADYQQRERLACGHG